MSPGLRRLIIVLCLGNAFAIWWMSGQNDPSVTGAADRKNTPLAKSLTVWSAESPAGQFWGNEKNPVIALDGAGIASRGKAIAIRFDGPGWRGCGLNWKGWFPAEQCDDVSKFRALVFHVRQTTQVPDADLTVTLIDNTKRADKATASNGLSVIAHGGISRIDAEWRKVILPLERFAHGRDLDLKRIWGIDFSDSSGRTLAFQIDRIAFTEDCPVLPKFPPSDGYAVTATIAVDKPGHVIRDEIYGVCELPRDKIAAYGIPIVRWGGNRSSRFNWKVNADNAGHDWFFKNGGHAVSDPAEGSWVRFGKANQASSATGYLTIPMLGFVAKDHNSHAYSVKKHGPQQATEMGHPDVGNGKRPDGKLVTGNDWRDTSVDVGPEFIEEGVRLVVRHAGSGVRYFALDNEPMLWHETHRDVRAKPLGYDELWDRTVQYAEAVKRADPTAKIAGFCSWGWTDLFYSAADEGGDSYRAKPDFAAHGRMPLAEWFIKKCGDYKREHGNALVDVFDFHWYPQAEIAGRTPYKGSGMDRKLNDLRLRTTRDLWDPDYKPESWVKSTGDGKPTMLLRRVRTLIEKHNPGMEVCVGEYNFGGGDNISGALAQTEVFGILARERADLAFIWTHPEGTQELAWQIYRDYDGLGGRFGDRFLPVEGGHGDLGIYAAKRTKDGATTIAIVNKNLGGTCNICLNVTGLKGKMRVWRYDQETECKVVEIVNQATDIDGVICLTIPAASGTMLVVDRP
jgi:Glycoside hydrolase family 44